MNPRLRHWREAATLLLAAGAPGRPPRSPLGPFDYELLLLQRSARSGFMPGAHVFPGGLLEPADCSAEWLAVLPALPRCALGAVKPPPPGSSRAPLFATDRERLGSPLPGEVAFRICALRETFEEAGILLLVPGRGPAPPLPAERLPPAAELGEWRRRVRADPSCFLQMCRRLGCAPNIWALHEWSNWLTPVGSAGPGGRRYDTAFYLCCLEQRPPHASQDDQEVTAVRWSSPPEAIECFKSQEIWFPPPQFYEFCRLCNFSSLSQLQQFSSERALEGCERWMPVLLAASDGYIQLLPGDELYPEDPDYTGEKKIIMSTDKKVEDLMKEEVMSVAQRINMDVLVLKIEDPSCFWLAVKGCVPGMIDEVAYEKLNDEMNQFYNNCKYVEELRPEAIEKGQVCVGFSEELQRWCRAVVQSVQPHMDSYHARCFLVDYAKYSFVDVEKPAKRWDFAAIQHFRNLLNEATEVKAMVQAQEDDVFQVFVFVTIKDEKICVNDDLVTKYFARYEEPKGDVGSSADDLDSEGPLSAEWVAVEFVAPTFVPRPKLPLVEKEPPGPETGLAGSGSILEETSQRSSTVVNANIVPMVNTTPGLPLKEDKAIQTDSKKIEPSSVLKTAPLFDGLKKELDWNEFPGPNFTESYCWPPAARGYDLVAISHQGNDPLLYIPPVLTLLQLKSTYQALPNTTGPLALIVCPGWKKAQLVFDLLKTYGKGCRNLRPTLILGQNKEAASHVKIQGCTVVVTTPSSLLRLLEQNSWLLCQLCHVVLDEVEVLFSDPTEQVFTILDCYKKATAQAQGNPLHQIIAVGTQWNKHITQLMEEFMNDPYVVVTVTEEAAICGNVQQVVQPCMDSTKITELLKILDFTHRNPQKVLVFTDSVSEVEMIHKDSSIDPEHTKAKSVILLTENNFCHALEILGYLQRAEAEIPQELHDLAARMLESEENEKLFSRPLCASLKAFGICKNRTACPDRHQVNLLTDITQNINTPESVLIVPFHIVHATNYFGRIVDKQKDQYAILAGEMKDYFKVPGHRISVNIVEKSTLYALYEGTLCHRVQVVDIPAKEEENPLCKVTIIYIDEGRTNQVNSDQLLHLPAKFQSLPPQALEFVVCRVKPVDNEIEWNPKVTDHIHHKIKGKLHHAKIVHTLGKTVWVDPMVDDVAQTEEEDDSKLHQPCFHPEIKWFQDNETVTLKVKILRPANTKCKFSKEKVVFSANSEEKFYLADLELQESILAEKSRCVIKDTEAVIVLAKEKPGEWCKLLKNKVK
ncbi:tudor domain containing 12 [Willisornis vidua]|uniref:RNA helicase n=1 Tax=Willisornis vidua TaxID=1566151 RepID=A0ABQ9CPC7_9PASS|nr:tudor domain containing 12 [Willisornis vidua]